DPSAHVPFPGLASTVSVVVFTVNVAACAACTQTEKTRRVAAAMTGAMNLARTAMTIPLCRTSGVRADRRRNQQGSPVRSGSLPRVCHPELQTRFAAVDLHRLAFVKFAREELHRQGVLDLAL